MAEMTKDELFDRVSSLGLALTYNDLRLKTGYSKTAPKDVSIESFFSRHTPLRCPIVSAAMDTITEIDMAIAMATVGGLGIIHRNLKPADQASQVRRVKLHLNGLIERPIHVNE